MHVSVSFLYHCHVGVKYQFRANQWRLVVFIHIFWLAVIHYSYFDDLACCFWSSFCFCLGRNFKIDKKETFSTDKFWAGRYQKHQNDESWRYFRYDSIEFHCLNHWLFEWIFYEKSGQFWILLYFLRLESTRMKLLNIKKWQEIGVFYSVILMLVKDVGQNAYWWKTCMLVKNFHQHSPPK